ncbi:sigma factor-like helix-turn-helix DNA-binding protein [Nonomuraea sediminis]|uniref:sigma factor-like helix-turn-helix DNA-binding protein n=1 Tax=Nonomuraea sediminis TaxID=2835864 RepID=UPI001BDCB3BD|nr:sigma factor-like helix-turn-helix DNA-binding protein [Nonomuraea sediminis]
MGWSPAQKEDAARQAAEVIHLRRRGETFEAIGEQLGVTRQRAHQIYSKALKEIPAQEVAEYRAEQAERLDEMLRAAYAVLEREHVTVSQGKVVRMGRPFINDDGYADVDENRGEVVKDDGPILMAIKTILQIEERRAKLFGLDTPVKQLVGGEVEVTYNFEGVDLV